MRINVLDLGSQTFHLLSADVRGGVVLPLYDAKVPVRIGEGAFRDGAIDHDAFQRGIAAIETLLAPLESRQAIAIATAVFRESSNAAAFLAEVRRRFDLDVRIISGEEEARLTYRAVCAEVHDPHARIAVIDLGGGSLECMLGNAGQLALATSFPLGALRLSTVLARGTTQLAALVTESTGTTLDAIRRSEPDAVVLTSGTARALLRVAWRLGRSEPVAGCLSVATLVALASRLSGMASPELAAAGVAEARLDTIATGAVVLATVVSQLGVPFVRVAQGAVREGLALSIADALERTVPRARDVVAHGAPRQHAADADRR